MEIRPENFGKARLVVNYLMLGDVNVGKSSLLLRFADKSFNSNPLTTIGIENRNVNLKVDDKPVTLQIWDTAGQEKWRQVPPSYYRGVKGIVLIYDLSNRTTFELISQWMEKIAENTEMEKLTIALVGNKSDLERQVRLEEGLSFATQHKMLFLETSAKTDSNVSELFQDLTKRVLSKSDCNKTTTKLNKSRGKTQDKCC